ncbi:DNA-binding protein [Pseudomonas juntendi]|uniref:DNA-binding protein n=1 Tax=Pseudomonas juntendi TaxID=2666183 RepID=UPI001F41801A|nr:DNA-binding protein [Pseudomonas juntendi]MCF3157337.1 DNA-binding protein [Pseudomonas juntendi]
MARGGVNLVLVRKAREALLARGQNPSIDAVRIELGNTGSKTTIQRYLKEIENHDTQPNASPSRLSDELSGLVEKLLERLLEEGNEALLHERASFERERKGMREAHSTIEAELNAVRQEVATLRQALESQDQALQTSQSSLQAEQTRNARISQSCADLEVRVREKDEQIKSLKDKHQHARDALEHYRTASREQRDQDQARHESQLHQKQQELTLLQQTLMVKQDEVTRLIRDNERLIGENRQQLKERAQHRDQIERLSTDIGIANAATARAEGARELLQQQVASLAAASDELRTSLTALKIRDKQTEQLLDQAKAENEALRSRLAAGEAPH